MSKFELYLYQHYQDKGLIDTYNEAIDLLQIKVKYVEINFKTVHK